MFHRYLVHVQLRPGGHDTLPAKPIDVSAFSYSKRTAHQSPLSFLKRGTGNGGTVIPFGSGEESSASGGAAKGGGSTRASARAAALKKTKLRDFQVITSVRQIYGTEVPTFLLDRMYILQQQELRSLPNQERSHAVSCYL